MKKDWTYKKLGDVCGIQYGYPFDSKCFTEDNTYPALIRIRDVVRGYTETFYKGDVPEEYYVQEGEYLIGMDGEFNIAPWRSEKALLNQRVCKIYSITPDVDIRFAYYSLQRQLKQIEDETPFVTVKHLSAKRLNQVELPIPPLSIQRSIVSELDLLHSVIEKKQEQLRALDNLAQSLFYQMFGDPITNPMGWQVKKLGEVSSLLNGRAYQQKELLDQGKYRVLRVGNFFTNNTWYYSDLELPEDKYCDKGDLLFTWSASFGAHIWNGDKVIYHYHIWKIVLDEMYVDKLFYLHLLNNMVKSMMHDTHGTGMLHLTKSGMEMYDIPLPPLSLQQSFAAKVSAIEEQKRFISQSIKDVESLLAQRMDHYFG